MIIEFQDHILRAMSLKLLFVYNADSGLFNSLSDYVHKVFSPKTYSCNLCKLTYGHIGMKKKWKDLISSLDVEVSFYHKDQFQKKFPGQTESYPCLYKLSGESLNLLLSSDEIAEAKDLDELTEVVRATHSSNI